MTVIRTKRGARHIAGEPWEAFFDRVAANQFQLQPKRLHFGCVGFKLCEMLWRARKFQMTAANILAVNADKFRQTCPEVE
ncbi:hypothetical protein D3C81_1875270 [compost metagenome]